MRFDIKHEPQRFAELIFAEQAARDICERYAFGTPYKSLMLWGEPGTAKTTTARTIAKERLGGKDYIAELDGAGFKMDKMEAKIINSASMQRISVGEAIVIINEFDELDRAEQAKFRAFMSQFTSINYIVTTNEKPSVFGAKQKLMPALLSRFEVVELVKPKLDDCLPRVQQIFADEGYVVTEAKLRTLLASFSGDIRDLLPLVETAVVQLNNVNSVTVATQQVATQKHLQVVSNSSSVEK